jgi:TPP-dependent pyruvate/acetoin dehydrogenase alpha subunit
VLADVGHHQPGLAVTGIDRLVGHVVQWAISTSRRVQSATPSFALRAAGYGFDGIEVDGNDVMAVYDVAVTAVERARKGDGPTLIEAVTYRMGFHNTTDNPSRYQNTDEYEEARRRDPIERVQKYLAGLGLWDQSREAIMIEELCDEIEAALEAAIAAPVPGPEDLFENVYEHSPERVLQQRAELLSGRPD